MTNLQGECSDVSSEEEGEVQRRSSASSQQAPCLKRTSHTFSKWACSSASVAMAASCAAGTWWHPTHMPSLVRSHDGSR
jgi:hypothetical protein